MIELLSPSNKRAGDDREQYLAKRRELLRTPAHLVEIDLLRGWTPMPQEGRPECDYSVMVSRAEKRRAADFWPIRLRDRLPVIPFPLRPPGRRRPGRPSGSAAPRLRRAWLRALHLQRRARTEPAGERRGLGAAVRAGENFSLSRPAGSRRPQLGLVALFSAVEYSKPVRRLRGHDQGTNQQERDS